jgi:hypothetical protein
MPDRTNQLSLLTFMDRPLYRPGWLACDCGLVFWIWPIATGKTRGECTGHTGAPDLRPFRQWQCIRDLTRMTPAPRICA